MSNKALIERINRLECETYATCMALNAIINYSLDKQELFEAVELAIESARLGMGFPNPADGYSEEGFENVRGWILEER